MGRHGENIRKRKDGRWEARYLFFIPNENRKIYRSVYGNTYEEVKAKRAAAILAARETLEDQVKNELESTETGNKKLDRQIVFSQVAAEWLKDVLDKRKYSTYVKYENIYKTHLEGIWGTCSLADISSHGIQEKLADLLAGEGLSDSIRRSICCISNQILAFANKNYFVTVPNVKFTGMKNHKKPVKVLSKEEQARLLTCIYDRSDKFKVAILLCLYTGMRLGELCALKWTDFDFKDMTVTVNRTVQRIAVEGCAAKTILMETDPKSECSKRTIPLVAEITELIKGLMGKQVYVFGVDKPLEPRTMQYRFQHILKEANIDDRNFHILRHTFATNGIENKMDAKALSAILGHSDVKITLNRYVHPTMDSRRRQIDSLPDFYGQIRGQVA